MRDVRLGRGSGAQNSRVRLRLVAAALVRDAAKFRARTRGDAAAAAAAADQLAGLDDGADDDPLLPLALTWRNFKATLTRVALQCASLLVFGGGGKLSCCGSVRPAFSLLLLFGQARGARLQPARRHDAVTDASFKLLLAARALLQKTHLSRSVPRLLTVGRELTAQPALVLVKPLAPIRAARCAGADQP